MPIKLYCYIDAISLQKAVIKIYMIMISKAPVLTAQ